MEDNLAEAGTWTITLTVISPVVKEKKWIRQATGLAWHIISTEISSFSIYKCKMHICAIEAQRHTAHLDLWSNRGMPGIITELSLTGDKWEYVTGPEAPCILGIDYFRTGYFKDPKGYRWAFGVGTVATEKFNQLSTLSGLSEDPSIVGFLQVKDQQVPVATTTVHKRQY
ncbi:hypothetical protein WISP_05744 [Willisornis vidua]|uniref:Uncharacterized protein n=1 Tax=Willisornis vidua TaxID=1566151 RepID=A0ABQ9DU89_9PASS|nr:hypothetical protein WISP_05744 [Willisornis vidua]